TARKSYEVARKRILLSGQKWPLGPGLAQRSSGTECVRADVSASVDRWPRQDPAGRRYARDGRGTRATNCPAADPGTIEWVVPTPEWQRCCKEPCRAGMVGRTC